MLCGMSDTLTHTATMTALTTDLDGTLTTQTIPRPSPGGTEVLIKVAAAGINPVDWKVRGSMRGSQFDPSGPMILGWDVAGEVVEVGTGVTRFAVGDRVFGMPRFPYPANAYAEYVVAGSREVARTPDRLTDVEAGALPLAVLTAWQAVVDTLDVGEGDRVLIHAASGGVGHLAVQIAKARGAEVWGTASAAKHDTLRELGLDHPIDHRTERFEEIARDMDAVIDIVGGLDHVRRSITTLRQGGRLVLIPGPVTLPPTEELGAAGVTATWMLVEPDHTALEAVADMVEAGTLRVIVGDTRPLDRIGELHDISKAGGPFGKLVATVS